MTTTVTIENQCCQQRWNELPQRAGEEPKGCGFGVIDMAAVDVVRRRDEIDSKGLLLISFGRSQVWTPRRRIVIFRSFCRKG